MVNVAVYLQIFLEDEDRRERLLQREDISDPDVAKILDGIYDGIYDGIAVVAESREDMNWSPELQEENEREVLIFNELSPKDAGKLVEFMYDYFEGDLAADTWMGGDLFVNDQETVSPHIYKIDIR